MRSFGRVRAHWVLGSAAWGLVACATSAAEEGQALGDVTESGSSADDGDKGGASSGDASAGATSGGPSNGSAGGGSSGSASGGSSSGSASEDAGAAMPLDGGGGEDASATCFPGTTACGDLCVDLASSAANCGTCGHACPGGQACDGAGKCLAPSGCTYGAHGGHDYFFCNTSRNWLDARNACLGFGIDLAVIETPEENQFIAAQGRRWIGLSDRDSEGSYLWVPAGNGATTAGPSAPFQPWHQDEPNNSTNCGFLCTRSAGEDCGETYDDGTWNDADCGNSQAFVCETH